MSRKLRVAVLHGGQSAEHEVSLMSAAAILRELDRSRYEVTPVFISREGRWDISLEQLREFDVVFPVLHGPMGEDGSVQGLLAVLGVPFVGADVFGSAVGMDKAIFKDIMRARGLPVTPYLVLSRAEWVRERPAIEARILADLRLPCFIKPARMGSSIGVTKVKSAEQLGDALDEAFRWDRKALAEQAVLHARELEVSVLGNDVLRASVVGEVVPSREFYDYAAKYLDEGEHASKLLVPAPLPNNVAEHIRDLAIAVTKAIDARGMARVDFLMNGHSGEVFVNEINTIPGFTAISMYPRLWLASGMSYSALLDTLIALALEGK
ncbi:MAG: D-alanine--D-alanine ligase family protein [Thermoflexales bacterium]